MNTSCPHLTLLTWLLLATIAAGGCQAAAETDPAGRAVRAAAPPSACHVELASNVPSTDGSGTPSAMTGSPQMVTEPELVLSDVRAQAAELIEHYHAI